MKRRVVSAVILSTMAMLLSGCIFPHWHDHDRGNHYRHGKAKRGGGEGGKRR